MQSRCCPLDLSFHSRSAIGVSSRGKCETAESSSEPSIVQEEHPSIQGEANSPWVPKSQFLKAVDRGRSTECCGTDGKKEGCAPPFGGGAAEAVRTPCVILPTSAHFSHLSFTA